MMQKNKFRYFMILWAGEFISVIGSGLSAFALSIYVYQETGKATYISLLTLVSFLPNVLLTPIAGSLADRFNRRWLMLIGDFFSGLGILWICVQLMQGQMNFGLILIGVAISSIFSSLLEPSYRATISELLTADEFSKASGLVQLAGASKFLLAPILAGFLMQILPIYQILMIDLSTFIITVCTITIVARAKVGKKVQVKSQVSLWSSLREGWIYMKGKQGIFTLLIAMIIVTFSIGFMQTLMKPMILALVSVAQEGAFESFGAIGMLVASLAIGMVKKQWELQKVLGHSFVFAGLTMALLGLNFPIVLLAIIIFCFFFSVPFANMSADLLLRTNVEDEYQGRVWGITGLISQLGYVIAYAISGPLADQVFNPLFVKNGALATRLGIFFGTGQSRGIGMLFFLTGLLLAVTGIFFRNNRKIGKLDSLAMSKISSEMDKKTNQTIKA